MDIPIDFVIHSASITEPDSLRTYAERRLAFALDRFENHARCVSVRIRDINVGLPLVLQILMFTTPVVYPGTAVPEEFRAVYWANPLAILVEDFRLAVLDGAAPNADGLLYCALVGGVFFLLAYSVFKRLEAKIVDEM